MRALDAQIWYPLTESVEKWVHYIGFKYGVSKRLNWTKSNLKRPRYKQRIIGTISVDHRVALCYDSIVLTLTTILEFTI